MYVHDLLCVWCQQLVRFTKATIYGLRHRCEEETVPVHPLLYADCTLRELALRMLPKLRPYIRARYSLEVLSKQTCAFWVRLLTSCSTSCRLLLSDSPLCYMCDVLRRINGFRYHNKRQLASYCECLVLVCFCCKYRPS